MITKDLGKYYLHIDNGGLSLEAKAFYHEDGEYAGAQLEIENSFYGYISNSMKLHVGKDSSSLDAKDFKAIADFFNSIADKLSV